VGECGGQKEVAQTMYIHVSKCKNDKIKKRKEKKLSSAEHVSWEQILLRSSLC
jgi:hypothetical protein